MNAPSPSPEFDKGPHQGPDQGLQQRLRAQCRERLAQVTQGFADYVSDLVQRGEITPADGHKVLADLRDPKVLIYLELWVALNLFDAVVRGDVITPLLYSSFGAAGAWLSETVRALFRNGLVQTAGAGLSMAPRQTLAFASMVPLVGDHAPLVFLLREYPELGRLFRAYLRRQTLKGLRARFLSLGLRFGGLSAGERIEERLARYHRNRQPGLMPVIERQVLELQPSADPSQRAGRLSSSAGQLEAAL